MKCPFCGHAEDRVLDTREQKDGQLIRRRRECLVCHARFTTVESISIQFPMVVKKDGRREPFNKEKILRGLQAACQKRAISLAQLEGIVERISKRVLSRGDRELAAHWLGQLVMAELRDLDDVAYVRFASVYRNFQDVQEFVETLGEDPPVQQEMPHFSEEEKQLFLAPELKVTTKHDKSTPDPQVPNNKGINQREPTRSSKEAHRPRTRPTDLVSS